MIGFGFCAEPVLRVDRTAGIHFVSHGNFMVVVETGGDDRLNRLSC